MQQARIETPAPSAAAAAATATATAEPAAPANADDWPIRPALFARYGDLDALRHPYPLVLIRSGDQGRPFRPLMRVLNDALAASAPRGSAGEAMRQNALRLEAAIRRRVSAGAQGTLSELWAAAARDELDARGEAPFGPMDSDFDHVREALAVDGPVIGCDGETPAAVLRHVWKSIHRERARAFRKKVEGLILRLADILKADFVKSDEAHQADHLRSAVGAGDARTFDFHTLSRMLMRQHPEEGLPEDRRHRIEWALLTLRSQRFYGPGRASERKPGQPEPHRYIFDSCSKALDAFRERLPETLEFVKALTVAELEVENGYDAAVYDAIIAGFDESDLTGEQLALLPTPLVCLRDGQTGNAETVRAFEALASGLPFKVLIQTDDILGPTTPEPPRDGFGGGSTNLAAMAMGLGNAFALQVSSAHLHAVADALESGMRHDGPALYCVYSGATPTAAVAPPYLLAAAASESRVFPTFCHDPSAGPDLARRFSLADNPQPEVDWPIHPLDWEGEGAQRQHRDFAFTAADFVICDSRYRRFCHPQPISAPEGSKMVPCGEWLSLPGDAREGAEPWVPGLDPDNRLWRVVIDEKIAARAWSVRDSWHRLQEFAGIGNSHVARALAEMRQGLQAEAAAQAAAAQPPAPETAQIPAAEAPQDPTAQEAGAPEPVAEEAGAAGATEAADTMPYIETPRCSTCNECTQINNRMFAYNEDNQAYIADPRAGTFRELVEAAESCQVSIIHPGQPLDPDEPDLEELVARAAEFT